MKTYKRLFTIFTLPLLLATTLLLFIGSPIYSLTPQNPTAVFTVNSTIDAVDANPGDGNCATAGGDCTLRAAIQESNASSGDDTITLSAATYTLSIAGEDENNAATGDLDILGNLIINGNNATNTIIDGNALDRVFDIRSPYNVTFANLTIQNGRANDLSIVKNGGGAIRGGGNLSLNGVVLRDNTAVNGNRGGAILIFGIYGSTTGSTLTIANSTLSGNTAAGSGGAIKHSFPEATTSIIIENSTLSDNSSGSFAGAIDLSEGSLNLKNVQFINNSATKEGGALLLGYSGSHDLQIEISDSLFHENSSDASGGSIANFSDGISLDITDSAFNQNSSNSGGAAIANFGDAISLAITNTNFISNTAVSWGGAMYITGLTNTLSIADSTFDQNSSNGNGGAVALYGPGSTFESVGVTAVISNSVFTGNRATAGGGALFQGKGTDITVAHSAFISNTANNGGALYSSSDGVTGAASGYLVNSTFSGNQAQTDGGAIYGYTLSTDLRFRNVTIAYNTADSDNNGSGDGGGMMLFNNPSFALSNSLIANNLDNGNEAPDCSGAFFSIANNLIGKTDGCPFTPHSDDLVGTIAVPLDPMLQPLTGAPAYHPLQINSPAIEAGVPGPGADGASFMNCPTTDQVGMFRPADGDGDGTAVCDIGAVEAPTTIFHLADPAIGSTLTYTDTQQNKTLIDLPAGSVTETTTLRFMPQTTVTTTANMPSANHAFTLNAYRNETLLPNFIFETPVTVTIYYSEADIVGMSEDSLLLFYWDGSAWNSDDITIIERDPSNNKLIATITHLSQFALLGESYPVYLPTILK